MSSPILLCAFSSFSAHKAEYLFPHRCVGIIESISKQQTYNASTPNMGVPIESYVVHDVSLCVKQSGKISLSANLSLAYIVKFSSFSSK